MEVRLNLRDSACRDLAGLMEEGQYRSEDEVIEAALSVLRSKSTVASIEANMPQAHFGAIGGSDRLVELARQNSNLTEAEFARLALPDAP